MQHVDKYGIGRVMEMTMDQLHGRPIHCSYDIGLAFYCVRRRRRGLPVAKNDVRGGERHAQ